MRILPKAPCVIVIAAVALTASADARSVNTGRIAGAHGSVSAPGAGSIVYDPNGAPYPTGHGGTSSSPDFQLVR